MSSWWSTKSKSMVKIGLPSTCPMGRVVIPCPVRWKGTFHQWLRRILEASRILPTTWQKWCRVALVSAQSANGIGGNSSMPAPFPSHLPAQRLGADQNDQFWAGAARCSIVIVNEEDCASQEDLALPQSP